MVLLGIGFQIVELTLRTTGYRQFIGRELAPEPDGNSVPI